MVGGGRGGRWHRMALQVTSWHSTRLQRAARQPSVVRARSSCASHLPVAVLGLHRRHLLFRAPSHHHRRSAGCPAGEDRRGELFAAYGAVWWCARVGGGERERARAVDAASAAASVITQVAVLCSCHQQQQWKLPRRVAVVKTYRSRARRRNEGGRAGDERRAE